MAGQALRGGESRRRSDQAVEARCPHLQAGFTLATGLAPIAYVQRLRIEDAKRRLERTDAPVDEVGWRVGYEDGAYFRRLFKCTTGMTPGAYRKRFQIPEFARVIARPRWRSV